MSRRFGQSSRRTSGKVVVPVVPVGIYGVTGALLWLKADAGVSLSGSNVTAWLDQSGAGNNPVMSTGNYTYAATGGFNGGPVLSAAGTASMTGTLAASANTIFAVCKNPSVTSAVFALSNSSFAANTGSMLFNEATKFQYGRRNAGAFDNIYNPAPLFVTPGLMSLATDTNFNQVRVNDVTNAATTTAGAAIASTNYMIGSLTSPSLTYPFIGDLYELIVFPRSLSAPDYALVEAGIRAKYSMPTVTSVTASSVPAMTATAITLTGANFVAGATVDISATATGSGTACTSVVVVNATTITCVTPNSIPASAYKIHVRNTNTMNGSGNITFV